MSIKEMRDLVEYAADIEQRTFLEHKVARTNLEMLKAKLEKEMYDLKKGEKNGTD